MAKNCITSAQFIGTLLRRSPNIQICAVALQRCLHTTPSCLDKFDKLRRDEDLQRPSPFLDHNKTVYPPTKEGEEPRPAEICHIKDLIPISAKKMWYATVLVRGMTIDEAIKQCDFSKKAPHKAVREALLEAQEKAFHEFNVEFKSNLWIADSYVTSGKTIKALKRSRRQSGCVRYRFSNYHVRLREGKPPKHYYPPDATGYELLEEYVTEQRKRRIRHGL